MPYATRQDLENLFGADEVAQLVLRHTDGDVAVENAIVDAGEEIDGMVAARYSVPFGHPVPGTIRRICCVIARYNLWGRNLGTEHPAYIAYRDELKTLEKVADGKIKLPAKTVDAEAPAATGHVQVRAPRRQFGSDTLERMP